MDVIPGRTKGGSYAFGGSEFHFCNPRCREKFAAAPSKYLLPVAESRRPAEAGEEYTCPMHPEVRQLWAGSCPDCGMELEDMTRRFWVSLAFAAPVFGFAMSEMIPGEPIQHALGARAITWIQFLLSTPAVLWGGQPLFARGWASIVNRKPNMFTLIP